jgi:serine/threonine protein kinase
LSKGLEDLLMRMLDKNPQTRIKACEIKEHDFIINPHKSEDDKLLTDNIEKLKI